MYDFVHAAKVLDAIDRLGPFDLVHNHTPAMVPLLGRVGSPHVTTVHGDPRRAPTDHVYRSYPDGPYVAVSRAQQAAAAAGMGWIAQIPHGIDLEVFRPRPGVQREEFLLHIGSLGRRKGTLDAIHLAKAVGRHLVIMGSWDPRDLEFCERNLMPYLQDPQITFLGERGDVEKIGWLQRAAALVHPLAWEEPYGLVIVEALACGLPVLALDRGAVGELVQHGRTGHLGTHWTDLIGAARQAADFSADACRASVLPRTVDSMVSAYLALYARLQPAGAIVSAESCLNTNMNMYPDQH